VFTLAKPSHPGIGFDALPARARQSSVLTGNDLARLAGVEHVPDLVAVRAAWTRRVAESPEIVPDSLEIEMRVGNADRALDVIAARLREGTPVTDLEDDCHRIARLYLQSGDVERAWNCILAVDVLAGAAL
jgi:hypothetical protein